MIKVQAHRGFSELYPENTMIAFQKAYEVGISGVELDVRKTADNEFVVMHDGTVDRTTNGTGNVSDLTLSYIKSLDAGSWFNESFAGEKVPTLVEVLDEFRFKDITLIIHLYADETDVSRVIDLISNRGMAPKVQIFGAIDVINSAKTYNPNIFTVNSGMATIANYQTFIDNAVTHNHDAVSINAIVNDNDRETMVTAIKNAGKLVHASYLQYSYDLYVNKHITSGTDFILGNNPAVMKSTIDNYYDSVNVLLKTNTFVKYGDFLLRYNSFEI